MKRTLSCLAIPNQTACSTSRPRRAIGLGTALCVEPTPQLYAQPAYAFKYQSMMLFVSFVLCIPQVKEVPAGIIYHFISEAQKRCVIAACFLQVEAL